MYQRHTAGAVGPGPLHVMMTLVEATLLRALLHVTTPVSGNDIATCHTSIVLFCKEVLFERNLKVDSEPLPPVPS